MGRVSARRARRGAAAAAVGRVSARRVLGSLAAVGALMLALAPEGPAATPSVAAPCAWAGETDQRDGNIGAPDLDAFYVMNTMPVASGERVRITGDFPLARYFSFHVYDQQGRPLGSLYDQRIAADPGSQNPFRRRVAASAGDRYTVHIAFSPAPRRPAANTLYVDPARVHGAAPLVYRIYVPRNPGEPSGGVPYPTVQVQSADGSSTLLDEPGCVTTPPPFGSALYERLAAADYPTFLPADDGAPATRVPTWTRSFGSALANQQNAYLGAIISRRYGSLVVLHMRAPSFPDTRAGDPPFAPRQVRYWSICTYDSQGQAGYGCAADYAASLRGGYATYVISDPGVRPANAIARDGVTWLPWGGNQASAQIVERNMLPRPDFTHAIQRITRSGREADPRRVMGAYFPEAVYCRPEVFARGGWPACLHAAHLRG